MSLLAQLKPFTGTIHFNKMYGGELHRSVDIKRQSDTVISDKDISHPQDFSVDSILASTHLLEHMLHWVIPLPCVQRIHNSRHSGRYSGSTLTNSPVVNVNVFHT